MPRLTRNHVFDTQPNLIKDLVRLEQNYIESQREIGLKNEPLVTYQSTKEVDDKRHMFGAVYSRPASGLHPRLNITSLKSDSIKFEDQLIKIDNLLRNGQMKETPNKFDESKRYSSLDFDSSVAHQSLCIEESDYAPNLAESEEFTFDDRLLLANFNTIRDNSYEDKTKMRLNKMKGKIVNRLEKQNEDHIIHNRQRSERERKRELDREMRI